MKIAIFHNYNYEYQKMLSALSLLSVSVIGKTIRGTIFVVQLQLSVFLRGNIRTFANKVYSTKKNQQVTNIFFFKNIKLSCMVTDNQE